MAKLIAYILMIIIILTPLNFVCAENFAHISKFYAGAVTVYTYRFGNVTIYITYLNREPVYVYRNTYLVIYDWRSVSAYSKSLRAYLYNITSLKALETYLRNATVSRAIGSRVSSMITERINNLANELQRLGMRIRDFEVLDPGVKIISLNDSQEPLKIPVLVPPKIIIDVVDQSNRSVAKASDSERIELIAKVVGRMFRDYEGVTEICDYSLSRYREASIGIWNESLAEIIMREAQKRGIRLPDVQVLGSNKLIFIEGHGVVTSPCGGWEFIANFKLINTRWSDLPENAKKWIINKTREFVDIVRMYIPESIPLYIYIFDDWPLPETLPEVETPPRLLVAELLIIIATIASILTLALYMKKAKH